MKRRDFLKYTAYMGAAATAGACGGLTSWRTAQAADKSQPGRWPFGLGTDHPRQTLRRLARTELGPAYAQSGFRPEDGILTNADRCLGGYEDGRDMPNITRGLVKRGYNDEQIRGILGGNCLRVFGQVFG